MIQPAKPVKSAIFKTGSKAHCIATALTRFGGVDEHLNNAFTKGMMSLMASCALRISPALLQKYSELIAQDLREAAYHQFLFENPLFVDPLARKLISKHKLGDDFITDFVMERLTGDYIVVEIEKPHDPIFTKGDDFSAQFTHGFGQILDFQSWLSNNIAYAQRKLPGVFQPPGVLVIGRRNILTPRQKEKLAQFQKNSPAITVACFDDLLSRTATIYENLQHR